MRKSIIALALVGVTGMFVISCGNEKKEHSTEQHEAAKEVKHEDNSSEDKAHDHSEEMAMGVYQCPMKCEGEKTYEEAGTCPECKMDLKEVKKTEE